MRSAEVCCHGIKAGQLVELEIDTSYQFIYAPDYSGPPISLTMPVREEPYRFTVFPPFFDGLLPEGYQLESLLRLNKLDRNDKFSHLLLVGADTVGAVTIHEQKQDSKSS